MPILKSKLFKVIKPRDYTGLLFLVLVFLITASALGFFVPRLVQEVFQQYDNISNFNQSLLKLGLVFFGIYLNRVFYQLTINRMVQKALEELRAQCFQRWIKSFETIKQHQKPSKDYSLGEVSARIMNDTESIRELITNGAIGIIVDLFFIIASLVSFILIHFHSGLVLVLAQVVACLILLWGSRFMGNVFLTVRRASGDLSRTVANLTGGIHQLYFTRSHQYAYQKSYQVSTHFLRKQLKANIWDASYYSFAESLYPVFLLILVISLPFTGLKEAAVIAVMIDLIQRSIGPLKDATGKVATFQRARSGFQRIFEFIEHLERIPSSVELSEEDIGRFKSLVVQVNQFSYGQDFSLKNISLKGGPGELIGLVGLSGSGKSTLLKLISGNIYLERGKIEIALEDLHRVTTLSYPSNDNIELSRYRSHIGLVSQDSHVFSESLAFNISLKEELDERLTEFWETIQPELPYLSRWNVSLSDTIHPKDLSVGQKQLIAGMRALYLQKCVVLLDEIASALDSELEASLRNLVTLLSQQCLTIIVAHRIETIQKANQIFVLHQGEIVATGRHEQLKKDSEIYQKFLNALSL